MRYDPDHSRIFADDGGQGVAQRLEHSGENMIGEIHIRLSIIGRLSGGDLALRLGEGRCPAVCGDYSRLRCRSEEHTSELQSLMRISYAVFCLTKKKM